MNRIILLTLCLLSFVSIASGQLVTLHNQQLSVKISPLGAELQSIKSVKTNREYLWQATADIWKGRAPFMFPVVVKFKDEQYTYQDKQYQMPLLGVVRHSELTFIQHSPTQVTFELAANAETLKLYPFAFKFEVKYQLKGTELLHNIKIINQGDKVLHYALGGHPGFALPLVKGKQRSDYAVTFSKPVNQKRRLVADGLTQREMIKFLINETELGLSDKRIPPAGMLLIDHKIQRIGVSEKGKPPFIEVAFMDFPNVNIWTPPGTPFVAIEPLLGHHDTYNSPLAIEDKTYLSQLAAKQSKSYQFAIWVNLDN
jgi:galactose mutarotase-like enzyme